MIGYVSPYTNSRRSSYTPSGPKLNLTTYYDEIAQHKYLISPNGDRPECFRHYEAIGLGAIPLTELDSTLYRHLQPGPVVYGMSNFYNLSEDSVGIIPYAKTNRRMVTEEYWIEHVDRLVGQPVRWHDKLRGNDDSQQQVFYQEFVRIKGSSPSSS